MRWAGMLVAVLLTMVPCRAEDPASVRHVAEGERLLTQGHLEQAISEYEAAANSGAGSALFLNRLGALYLRAARYDEAAAVFKRSLREKADQLPIYSKLGEAYLAAGELDSALQYVHAARMLAPGNSSIHSSLAFLFLQRGSDDLPLARAHLDTALQLAADNPEAYRYLGYYLTQVDSVAAAIAAYVRVTELQPEHFEAYNNLGFLYAAQGDFTQALKYYELARARISQPELIYAINDRIETIRAMLDGKLRARFILVESRAEAADLRRRLQAGEDFASLARENSTAANADAGGDTGFFGPGELLPAFEQAVLNLQVTEISDIVELPIGFMLIERMN